MFTRPRHGLVIGTLCAAALAGCAGPEPTHVTEPAATEPPAPVTPVAPPAAVPPAASGAPEGPAAGPARCTTAELRGSLGSGDSGAGSTFRPLLLTNVGNCTCELVGYPGVSYVTAADGRQVGPAAEMDGPRVPQVVLAPGVAAAAPLRLVNVGNFDAAACRPEPVRGLRVYPPGDTASLFVPFEGGTGCAADPGQPQLFVQAVRPA